MSFAFLKKGDTFCFFILGAVVLAVFNNALFNGFVYDDNYLIIENPFIKDFRYLPDMLLSDVTTQTSLVKTSGYYRPASMVFLMMAYKICGLSAFKFHLANVVLHLLNTLLVFSLVHRISRERMIAFFSALIFAVHPVHVEAVTPIYNFMGLLAAFFSLISFVAFIKSEGGHRIRYVFLSLATALLAFLSKEESVMLPFIFLLYDYCFVSSLNFRPVFKRWKVYLGFVAASGLYFLLRTQAIDNDAILKSWQGSAFFNVMPPANIVGHFLTVTKIFARYIEMLLFPFNLCAVHIIPAANALNLETIFSALLVVGVMVAAIYWRKKNTYVFFFILMFFLGSFLISNIVPIGGLFAERFMYFPSVAYCALFGFVFVSLVQRFRQPIKRSIIVFLGFLIFISYALYSVERNYVWRNDLVLWTDTVHKSPTSVRAHLNLANAHFKYRQFDAALKEYAVTINLNSEYEAGYIHNRIGIIYGKKGFADLAIGEFNQVLAIGGYSPMIDYNLGLAYLYKGDTKNAKENFEKALSVDKKHVLSYYWLALICEKEKEHDKAVELLQKALQLSPQFGAAKQVLERLSRQKI